MLKNAKQESARRAVMVLLTVLIILRDLFTNLYYLRPIPALHANIWELLIIGQFWTICLHRKEKTKLERLLLIYAAWGLLTRFVLRDFTGKISLEVLVLFEMCVAFFAMHNLDKEIARRAFDVISAVLCVVLTVWAVCGLIVILTPNEKIRLLNEVVQTEKGYLEFFPINRNETSAWFLIGFGLTAYQWVVCKRKLWRSIMVFSMVLMNLAISLQQSRTIYLVVGFTVGLLLVSPMLERPWKNSKKYLLMTLTVTASTFVTYMVYFGVNAGLNALSRALLKDTRNFTEELMTMSGRMAIWKSELYALIHHPHLLIFGQKELEIPQNMIKLGGLFALYGHTHNGALQVLAMYGLPGLAIAAVFLFCLVRKLMGIYFGKVPTSEKILLLILVGLMIQSIMEPVFTAWMGLSTVLFMMVAGRLTREDTAQSAV